MSRYWTNKARCHSIKDTCILLAMAYFHSVFSVVLLCVTFLVYRLAKHIHMHPCITPLQDISVCTLPMAVSIDFCFTTSMCFLISRV